MWVTCIRASCPSCWGVWAAAKEWGREGSEPTHLQRRSQRSRCLPQSGRSCRGEGAAPRESVLSFTVGLTRSEWQPAIWTFQAAFFHLSQDYMNSFRSQIPLLALLPSSSFFILYWAGTVCLPVIPFQTPLGPCIYTCVYISDTLLAYSRQRCTVMYVKVGKTQSTEVHLLVAKNTSQINILGTLLDL